MAINTHEPLCGGPTPRREAAAMEALMLQRVISRGILAAAALLAVALSSTPGRTQSVDISAAMQHPAVQAAMSACMADRDRLCAYVLPGGGRIVRCLAAKSDQLTPNCHARMEQARDALFAAGLATQGGQAR